MRRRFTSSSKVAFDYLNYMTIEALDDEVKILYTQNSEYGINGVGWNKYIKGFDIIINRGQLISFKNNLNPGEYAGQFNIVGKCNLRGNCLSMIFGDNAKDNKDISLYERSFVSLFASCTGIQLVDKKFLPATKLASYCYRNMFGGCTGLVNAPDLPATILSRECYYSMFYRCTSLTTAPELPAATLVSHCYDSMFYGCSKLNYIKMLAIGAYLESCLDYWVYGVSSTGTFIKNPAMTSLPTGYSGIPHGWTVVNDGE